MMRPYRVTLSRAGCATIELTILAVNEAEARGACAWLEADGWRWVRAEPMDAASPELALGPESRHPRATTTRGRRAPSRGPDPMTPRADW